MPGRIEAVVYVALIDEAVVEAKVDVVAAERICKQFVFSKIRFGNQAAYVNSFVFDCGTVFILCWFKPARNPEILILSYRLNSILDAFVWIKSD